MAKSHKDFKLRRPLPDIKTINERKALLENLHFLDETELSSKNTELLSLGNTKTGIQGRHFQKIFVWNLPAVKTCPGASHWCLSVCYNADSRKEIFPVEMWNQNRIIAKNRPQEFIDRIVSQLSDAPKPNAVRIHSSGDFFSVDYIMAWIKIVGLAKETTFWAYTRSWSIEILLEPLEELKKLPNVQLFASWDSSMPNPPLFWRISKVFRAQEDAFNTKKKGDIVCPEQFENGPNCVSCGFCMKKDLGDVLFLLH